MDCWVVVMVGGFCWEWIVFWVRWVVLSFWGWETRGVFFLFRENGGMSRLEKFCYFGVFKKSFYLFSR